MIKYWNKLGEDGKVIFIILLVLIGAFYGLYRLGAYSNKVNAEQSYKKYLNPIEGYKCHDNGLSVLLEYRHINKNCYFINDFNVIEKTEKE
jgi:hypothetical protein